MKAKKVRISDKFDITAIYKLGDLKQHVFFIFVEFVRH